MTTLTVEPHRDDAAKLTIHTDDGDVTTLVQHARLDDGVYKMLHRNRCVTQFDASVFDGTRGDLRYMVRHAIRHGDTFEADGE